MAVALTFEKPIADLYEKVRELRTKVAREPGLSSEIESLERQAETLSKELFKDLTPIQKVQLSRHPNRPYTLDYAKRLLTDFVELRGDNDEVLGTIAELSNLDKSSSSAYTTKGPYSLAKYAGKLVKLQFRAVNDANTRTAFRIDSVVIQ